MTGSSRYLDSRLERYGQITVQRDRTRKVQTPLTATVSKLFQICPTIGAVTEIFKDPIVEASRFCGRHRSDSIPSIITEVIS